MELGTGILALAIIIFSAILHEIAHGFVAEKLGDPTARLAGRLTLNPRKHIDLFLSIILPLVLLASGSPIIFGGAKPVPVDPFNLKEGRKDLAIVSLSGPLTNVLIATAAAIFIRTFPFLEINWLFLMIVQLNLLLAIFNLLPIPPLDGSKVFALLLPSKQAAAYMSLSSIGFFILFFLLFFPLGGFSLVNFISNLVSFSQSLLLP